MPEDRTYECEQCGHAYTESYGRWHTTWISSRWFCHPCAAKRFPQEGERPVTIETVRTLLDIADRLEYTLLSAARTSSAGARVVAGLRALIDDELAEIDRQEGAA